MTKTIGVVGAGNMGKAIAWAVERLGYELVVVDQNIDALDSCKDVLEGNPNFYQENWREEPWHGRSGQPCSAIISSLPYHQNLDLARFCIDHTTPYFDLGGSVGVSRDINSYANRYATAPVLTDLGLAPGWVNIIAEHMYQWWTHQEAKVPDTVTMMVGGLPQHPNNTLKYTCTWSHDGLINEYRDDCVVLMDGNQGVAKGMDGYQFPISSRIGPLEAFYTSGGAAHTISAMQKRGVQNCSYKTLRYPQHRQLVNFLIHESGLTDASIIEIFQRTCPPQDDLVIIKVTVQDLDFERVIKSNEKFSAMQQATAFPAVSAVHTILENESSWWVDHPSTVGGAIGPVLKYTDIDTIPFNKALDRLLEGWGGYSTNGNYV